MSSIQMDITNAGAGTTAKAAIPVLEIFGPTVQGEGMSIGRRTMFVRTAGCDYRCSWCDSAFTWDGSAREELKKLSAEDVWTELTALAEGGFDHVTLSGGNPLLLPQLVSLVELLRAKGVRTAVETQGSVWQDWVLLTDEVTLSPKPPSSGMTTDLTQLDNWVARLKEGLPAQARPAQGHAAISTGTEAGTTRTGPAYSLKIVIFSREDLDYAARLHARYPEVSLILQTGNPEPVGGETGDIALRLLAAYENLLGLVMERKEFKDVRVLPQLHALVWGNKRGV